MIIDLNKILRSGKDEEDFFFEYVPEEELSTIPNVEVKFPIKVVGKVTLTAKHTAYLEGEVCFDLEGDCTRCLEKTRKSYVFPFSEPCGEENEYPVVNDKIDLAELVKETVIVNLPVAFLCKEDCKGICLD